MERSQALALLQKYNKEPFHIMHALTVEGVIRWYAQELGYGDDVDFWGLVGSCTTSILSSIPMNIVKKHRNS